MRALEKSRAEWHANQATDAPRVTFEEWAWEAGFRHKFLREAHERRQASGDYVDLFAGPGGWDVGLRMLGIDTVRGFEWDAAACATAVAAGFRRVQADISKLDPRKFNSTGLIASPPCTKFSAAGSGVGTRVLDFLTVGIRAIFAGSDAAVTIEKVRAAILPTCLEEREAANAKRRKPWPATKVQAKAAEDAFTTALVLEPARWLMGMGAVRWVALEQVPQVLPLWKVYAECLQARGWHVWTGVLNAADYGVPQTRRRAILTASLDHWVTRPEPTHAEKPLLTLFSDPARWVTMAEALGWGFDEPSATVSSGGAATGGAEPFGNAGYRRRLSAIVTNQRSNGSADYYERDTDRPAPALTTNVRLWSFRQARDSGPGAEREPRDADEPSYTIRANGSGKHPAGVKWVEPKKAATEGRWDLREDERPPVYVASSQANAARRSIDEPAPTVVFGHSSNDVRWVGVRPSTTVAADLRIAKPGHRDREGGERQHADSIRVTVQEAAILQSFPADYPWQGSKTKQYEQVGNAIPPLLAAHVLASVLRVDLPLERAA